jgi:hypothetical protein
MIKDLIVLVLLIVLSDVFFFIPKASDVQPPTKFNGADTLKIFFVNDSITSICPLNYNEDDLEK